MSDYIERSVIDRLLTIAAAADGEKKHRTWAKAICVLKDAPAADVVEARRGRWERCVALVDEEWALLTLCSECGLQRGECTWNFCPNCGAKMDGGDNHAVD